MREAIGGAFLIKLMMFFIVLYIIFLTLAINYSITFRVKNQIINLIEQYEGYDNAKDKISTYLADIKYFRPTNLKIDYSNADSLECQLGYCVESIDTERGSYYKVTTFVSFDFPLLNFGFPVSGETRVIYKEV